MKTIKLKTCRKSNESGEYVYVQDRNEHVRRNKHLKRKHSNIDQLDETVYANVEDNLNIRRLPGFENTSQKRKEGRLCKLYNTLRLNTRKGQSVTQV